MGAAPLAFSHVGVTVPDLDSAVAWYRDVLGYYVLAGPLEVNEDQSPLGRAAAGIYGEGFTRFRFTHMASIDGGGLELFQFDHPSYEEPGDFRFWRGGIYHLALTTPDVASLAERIAAHGGRQRSDVVTIDEERGFQIVYCEDPWGTTLELCSHLYPYTWSL